MKPFWISAAFYLFVVVFVVMAGWKIAGVLILVIGTYAIVMRVVQRRGGTGQRFIDNWRFEAGENIIWRNDRADCGIVPAMGRARVARPLRLHMSTVVVTTRRIIIANVTLFTKRRAVLYVLQPGTAPDTASQGIGGGLFRLVYITYVIQPEFMDLNQNGRLAYVGLKPAVLAGASFGFAEIRIYSDMLDSFRLPGA